MVFNCNFFEINKLFNFYDFLYLISLKFKILFFPQNQTLFFVHWGENLVITFQKWVNLVKAFQKGVKYEKILRTAALEHTLLNLHKKFKHCPSKFFINKLKNH